MYPLSMGISHSYVSLPQGKSQTTTMPRWSLRRLQPNICRGPPGENSLHRRPPGCSTRWATEPKSNTARNTPVFFKILWFGQLCSLRSWRKIFILRHHAHWWSNLPQHAMAITSKFLHLLFLLMSLALSHLSSRCSCPGSRFICLAAGGARTLR